MSDQPNILLISVDQWSAELLGVHGHDIVQTPTLDQLARNGTTFVNTYSSCPVCIPARRTLLTGTTPRTHGVRTQDDVAPMPSVPTLASVLREAGYQANAVGKLHVYPQRNRIGFDDVILSEEGRLQYGVLDDFELFLGDHGYAGQHFAHGMSSNHYMARPWHLPEHLHVTNWATQQMARTIKRRDPTRPAFWYLSYLHPHPPLVPPKDYWMMYQDIDVPKPLIGQWASNFEALPYSLQTRWVNDFQDFNEFSRAAAIKAFYALCTHLDHQLRVVLGTLIAEGLMQNTIIAFVADHGDMLGQHHLWSKRLFYDAAARVPFILVGTEACQRVGHHQVDDRLVSLEDIMPTLLDLADVPIPETVDGLSCVSDSKHQMLFGEYEVNGSATRMIHRGDYKLIYYPAGNVVQLFDMINDPHECHNLATEPEHDDVRNALVRELIANFYDEDHTWVKDGNLIGVPPPALTPRVNRNFNNQRGTHWPPPQPGLAENT